MDEYIKKNQALCCFSGWIDQNGDFHEPDEMIEYQRIEQLTAADVVPVRHGRWKHKKDLKQFFCDQCGEPSLTEDDVYFYGMEFPNFCPNCGADMRKDGGDGSTD